MDQHRDLTLPELMRLVMVKSGELDLALGETRTLAEEFAEADREWRRRRAKTILESHGGSADKRSAEADLEHYEYRFKMTLKEGLLDSAREAARARQTQLTAIQTLINATRQEMAFAQMGPQTTP